MSRNKGTEMQVMERPFRFPSQLLLSNCCVVLLNLSPKYCQFAFACFHEAREYVVSNYETVYGAGDEEWRSGGRGGGCDEFVRDVFGGE